MCRIPSNKGMSEDVERRTLSRRDIEGKKKKKKSQTQNWGGCLTVERVGLMLRPFVYGYLKMIGIANGTGEMISTLLFNRKL